MNGIFEAAREVCEFMAARGWEYCIIGGLAVQRWGEPRTTLDADVTLLADWGDEARYAAALLDRFEARISDAQAFAVERRVVLIRASNGKDVDIALGALPFEVDMVRQAKSVEFAPGIALPCCTAEDLFVMKAFAGRPRDWVDAEGIVARQSSLDAPYIVERLKVLCDLKDDPDILERAKRLLERNP